MKSPWSAINPMKSEIKYWSLTWAKRRLEKMGKGYALYQVNGWYYIGIDGDFRCKIAAV